MITNWMAWLHGSVIRDIQVDDLDGQLFAVGQCAEFCCRRGVPPGHRAHASEHDVSLACQDSTVRRPKPLLLPVTRMVSVLSFSLHFLNLYGADRRFSRQPDERTASSAVECM